MYASNDRETRAVRAWVAQRIVYIELSDGRVFGVPARHVERLKAANDEQLERVTIDPHSDGRSLRWQLGPDESDFASLSVRDAMEGHPRAVRAWIENRTVLFELRDGRVLGFPADNFERLAAATDEQLAAVEIQADGYGLRWEAVDEDISVPGIVAGFLSDRKAAAS